MAPEVWEKVAHKLRTGDMPPAGRPRPEPAVSMGLASYLETELDKAAAAIPNAGRVAPHRLNRTEYTNAVRDLLGLEIPVSLLPIENSTGGFDNIAGALTVSPMLLERYMSLGRQVSRLAVGDATMMVAPVLYGIDGTLKQRDRASEDLPFGARGVTVRHSFPLDGEYTVQLRLRRTQNEYIRGLGRHAAAHRRSARRRAREAVRSGGVDEGHAAGRGLHAGRSGRSRTSRRTRSTATRVLEARFFAKAGMPRAGAGAARAQVGCRRIVRASGRRASRTRSAAATSPSRPWRLAVRSAPSRQRRAPAARRSSRCRPTTEAELEPCATKILSTIARRAYRRPVNDGEVQTLLRFCRAGLSKGFDGCIQARHRAHPRQPALPVPRPDSPANSEAVASRDVRWRRCRGRPRPHAASAQDAPANLTDADAAEARPALSRLSDIDLASRLSFFLWSSIPDDELLGLAEKGRLRDRAVLDAQVKRMLADPRSRALVDNFSAQWLELRRLEGAAPVEDVFPEFDGELRLAFKEETERLIDSMMREDRPIADLLTANYSFINERLARHYGIPNIVGNRFRKVTMPANRVGLLGHGSILTVTSQANRTSPVLRGKWVLDNILGSPVPPPPPNIDTTLKPDDDDGAPLTVRAALERHRTNPVCANCHVAHGSVGLRARELRRHRRLAHRRTVASRSTRRSVLLDGTQVDGPAGVQQVLQARRDQFVKTVSEKLMVYALGRPVEYYDRPALRKITTEAAAHNNRWSSVILGIVNSMPFQYQSKGAE